MSAYELSPAWIAEKGNELNASQLFVVAGVQGSTAWISMHEKDEGGAWRELLTTPGYVGKRGLGKEREGDWKTPVGVYHFTHAFGINPDPGCKMPYHQLTEDDYWSSDERPGMRYNEFVKISEVPGLDKKPSEHLAGFTVHYRYCLNISWNTECIPGRGSAIFVHCFGPQKPYSGGCVTLPEAKMKEVMCLVKPECTVLIDSLENLSPETWKEWDL